MRKFLVLCMLFGTLIGTTDFNFQPNNCWNYTYDDQEYPLTRWARASTCGTAYVACAVGTEITGAEVLAIRSEVKKVVTAHFGVVPYIAPCRVWDEPR